MDEHLKAWIGNSCASIVGERTENVDIPFYDQLITDLLAELGASGYSKQMFLPFAGYAIEKSLIIQYF